MCKLPFKKLNESNYHDWKFQMEALLEERGLFRVVSGEDTMPTNVTAGEFFLDKKRLAREKLSSLSNPPKFPIYKTLPTPLPSGRNVNAFTVTQVFYSVWGWTSSRCAFPLTLLFPPGFAEFVILFIAWKSSMVLKKTQFIPLPLISFRNLIKIPFSWMAFLLHLINTFPSCAINMYLLIM